jgi:isopenicillin N synthase-like dioxygenase
MYMGVDLAPDHPLVVAGTPHHGANQWPDFLPGWKESVQGYFDVMERLSFRLLDGLALSLDLPWGYFDFGLPDAMTSLRLLRYPSQPDADGVRQVGAGAHTDWGVLTILAQDEIGGLQIRLRSGDWIEAPPIPGTFIVNIGDMMARWTNDLYASTEHRVLNRSSHTRHSVAFFMDTNYHTRVECLPTCCSPDNPPRYAPILAGDHLIEMKHRSYGYTG